jgi:hypothetical protein
VRVDAHAYVVDTSFDDHQTVAASGASFVALLASASETAHRVTTRDVSKGGARIPEHQEDGIADAA